MLDFGFYNMDCMDGMREFPDRFFDLAIVDPPYGIGWSGAKNHMLSCLATSQDYNPFAGDDLSPPPEGYFKELFRVSKNQIIWGANHFIGRFYKDSSCWIVWDKQNGDNFFADCELAWTSFSGVVRKFTFRWQGMLQGNMAHKEIRIHPTQKPVALYDWLLSRFSKPGDKILDTHVGSASSLIACERAGLPYVGFELDPDYYQKAMERLETERAQMSLFTESPAREKMFENVSIL